MERVYISDGAKELKYTTRTFRKWCKTHGIKILCDLGSRKQYILYNEFECAKNKAGIEYLVKKHGKNAFPDVLSAQMKLFVQIQSALDTSKKENHSYIPSGEHEKSFLARLQNITTTL